MLHTVLMSFSTLPHPNNMLKHFGPSISMRNATLHSVQSEEANESEMC